MTFKCVELILLMRYARHAKFEYAHTLAFKSLGSVKYFFAAGMH